MAREILIKEAFPADGAGIMSDHSVFFAGRPFLINILKCMTCRDYLCLRMAVVVFAMKDPDSVFRAGCFLLHGSIIPFMTDWRDWPRLCESACLAFTDFAARGFTCGSLGDMPVTKSMLSLRQSPFMRYERCNFFIRYINNFVLRMVCKDKFFAF